MLAAFFDRHLRDGDGSATPLPTGTWPDQAAPRGDMQADNSGDSKGRVGVSGPHPEADESWYADKGLRNPDGVRLDLAYELIEAITAR
ncbi:hypothetical protein NONI108955_06325 [Nocardia ninae]